MEDRCVREVPREFEPWIFLVQPILMKLSFLYSVRTKLSEFGVSHESGTIFNFSHTSNIVLTIEKKSSETKFERITSRNFFQPISHYARVHGKNNAYHNDNKVENQVIYE